MINKEAAAKTRSIVKTMEKWKYPPLYSGKDEISKQGFSDCHVLTAGRKPVAEEWEARLKTQKENVLAKKYITESITGHTKYHDDKVSVLMAAFREASFHYSKSSPKESKLT